MISPGQTAVQFYSNTKLATNEKKAKVINLKHKYGESKDNATNVMS
jgi:hypothetical protein